MNDFQNYIEIFLQWCGVGSKPLHLSALALLAVFTVLLAWLSDWICRRILLPLVHKVVRKTKNKHDDVLLSDKVVATACHIVPAIVVWGLLPRVFEEYTFACEIVGRLTAIYITFMAVRLCLTFLSALASLRFTSNVSTLQYVKSFCGVLRIVVLFFGSIIAVGIILNRDPLTLLAGLGAASAVLMLVFKDTIAGLVAGVRLTSADMLHPGDWITVPSAEANGTVMEVSLTTVKVRNFDNTITTISPTTLVNGSFQNWSYMQGGEVAGRRVAKVIVFDTRSLRRVTQQMRRELCEKGYFKQEELEGDFMNLQLFRSYVESWLRKRDEVVSDGSCEILVRDMESSEVGLPVQFYFFLKRKKWKLYEQDASLLMEWIFSFIPDFHLAVYERR